jgi:signal transduction histidine kinase
MSLHDFTRSGIFGAQMPITFLFRLQVAKVFQPFHRGTEGRANGIGLGLSIAKTLVEKMGGAIGVRCGLHAALGN